MHRVKRQRLKRRLQLYALRLFLIPLILAQLSVLFLFMFSADAEAAALTVASAVSETEQNTTSTSYTASDTSISSGSLPAGTYFVTWGAQVANSSGNNVGNSRLVRGSTEIAAISYEMKAASLAEDGTARSGYWLGTLSGSEALAIEYSGSAGTTYIDSKFIKAVRLDDKLIADTDYFTSGSQESSSDEVANASTSGFTDIKTLTKTFGSATENYIVFASMEISPDSTSNDCTGRLEVDGTASMTSTQEGEDTADQQGYAVAKVYSIASGSKSIKLQGQSVGGATCDYRRSRIYVFRANIFDQVVESYASGESTLASGTWTDKNSQSYTPNQSETVMVIGSRLQSANGIGCVIATRYDDGTAQYVDTFGFTPNNTADYAIGMSAMSKTVSSTTTFKVQFRRMSGTCTVGIKESTMILWSMTLKPAVAKQSAYRWFSNTVSSGTQSWWDAAWKNRRKITLNNSASTESLSNFPIRVSLAGGTNIDYSKTQNSGQDIRFVDSDNSTALKYEIEKWDESGTSEVWVKVPQIDSGSTTDYIWMYYNNTSASDGQDPTNVWDSDYKGVWHMHQDPSTTCTGTKEECDSTSNNVDADAINMGASNLGSSGQINGYLNFNGADENLDAGTTMASQNGTFTAEAWIRPSSVAVGTDMVLTQAKDGDEQSYTLEINRTAAKVSTVWGNSVILTSTASLSASTWQHIAVTRSGSAGNWTARIYINGALDSTASSVTTDPNGGATTTTCIAALHDSPLCSASGVLNFSGDIDEARVSSTARSTEWMEATYITTTNAMNTFGSEDAVWWDSSWSTRRKITFDNSASTENLTSFPVRVSLVGSGGSQNIDYDRTQSAGQDLRFIDENGTTLKYEIEKFDESGTSEVWVKVPQINSGATNDYIWMYYGNGSASAGQDATNVWDSNYSLVQHLEETSACSVTFTDSTTNGNNGSCNGSGPTATSSGKINGAREFSGSTQYISVSHASSLTTTNGTYETWFTMDSTGYHFLIEKGSDDIDNYSMYVDSSNHPVFFYRDSGNTGHTYTDTTTTVATNGSWYHMAAVFDDTNNLIKIYINGSQTFSTSDSNTPQSVTDQVFLGAENFGGGPSSYHDGFMDEARISNVARSGEWIEATYKNQNNQMNSYSASENNIDYTPLAAANTAYTLTSDGQAFRLRLLLNISTNFLYTGDVNYKLQYALKSGTCDTGYSGETYGDVGTASGDIRYKDNTSETDGSAIIPDSDDPTNGSNTIVPQTYEEANNFTSTSRINIGQDGKWEFALVDFSAAANDSYCFRVVKSDGSTIATPDVVPEITMASGSNNAPSSPSSLAQKKTDDTTLSTGSWTNETSIKLTATVTDSDGGDTIKICAEVDPVGTAFTSPSGDGDGCSTSGVSSGGTATVTISGLSADTEYHWQIKAKDAAGAYSSWVTYGGNTENPPTNPAARDFGVDTTAPSGGTVYDGTETDVDKTFSDTSLTALSANWSGFNFNVSGIQKYEYSIGTSAGATDIKGWTNASTDVSVTASSLTLKTSEVYYFNIKAYDNAGNTVIRSSNGQLVAPSLTFSVSPASLTFDRLNAGNSYTDSGKSTTLTTSTNAYGGYKVRQAISDFPRSPGNFTIPDFSGGSYASPAAWSSSTGFGFTTTDADIFPQSGSCAGGGTAPCYAPYSQTAPGDIVASHTGNGAGSPVTNDQITINHRVTVTASQAATGYVAVLRYAVTAIY